MGPREHTEAHEDRYVPESVAGRVSKRIWPPFVPPPPPPERKRRRRFFWILLVLLLLGLAVGAAVGARGDALSSSSSPACMPDSVDPACTGSGGAATPPAGQPTPGGTTDAFPTVTQPSPAPTPPAVTVPGLAPPPVIVTQPTPTVVTTTTTNGGGGQNHNNGGGNHNGGGNNGGGGTLPTGPPILISNDGGKALFTLPQAGAGNTVARCITIKYKGSKPAHVRFYATRGGTGLDRYIQLTVTRGKSSTSTRASCAGFTADTKSYVGAGKGITYDGLLSDLGSTFGSTHDDPTAATPESWTNGETHTYKIAITIASTNAAQGLTASFDFIWQAQG
jgi:hypothetical protein